MAEKTGKDTGTCCGGNGDRAPNAFECAVCLENLNVPAPDAPEPAVPPQNLPTGGGGRNSSSGRRARPPPTYGQEISRQREVVTTPCGHLFHHACVLRWFERNNGVRTCPSCRAAIPRNHKLLRVYPVQSTTDNGGILPPNGNLGFIQDSDDETSEEEDEDEGFLERIAELEAEVSEKDDEIEELNSEIQELRQEVTSAEAEGAKKDDEIDELNSELEELREKVSGMQDEAEDFKAQVSNLEDDVAQLEMEVEDLQDQISTLEEELANSKDEVNQLKRRLQPGWEGDEVVGKNGNKRRRI